MVDLSSYTPEQIQAELTARGESGSAPQASAAPQTMLGSTTLSNVVNGIDHGAENFGTNALASFRSVTDALGLTSQAQTDAGRQQMAQSQQGFDQSQAGQSIAGKIGQFAGQSAPFIAAGVAGGVSGAAGNAGLGALQSGLTDSGDGITGQLKSAAVGGILGGIIGKVTGGIANKFAFEADPIKEAAFRELGMTPRASQIALDPVVSQTYANIEKTLATAPGWLGIKGAVATQDAQFQPILQRIVHDLDAGPVSSKALFAQAVDAPELLNKTFPTNSIGDLASTAAANLKSSGKEVQDIVNNTLNDLSQRAPQTMQQLQSTRQGIDDIMNGLKGDNSAAAKLSFNNLNAVRREVSDTLTRTAAANGVGDQWAQGNAAWLSEKWVDAIQNKILPKAFTNGPEGVGQFDAKAFVKLANKEISHLEDQGFQIPAQISQSINAIQQVGAQLYSKEGLKTSAKAATGGFDFNPLNLAGKAAGVWATLAHPGIIGPTAAIAKGMSLLVSTPTGTNLLANMSNKPMTAAASRLALTSAAALGLADMTRHPAMAASPIPSTVQRDPSTLTKEQITAELKARGEL